MSAPLSRSTAASFLASFASFTASVTSAICNKGSQCLSILLLKPAASEPGLDCPSLARHLTINRSPKLSLHHANVWQCSL